MSETYLTPPSGSPAVGREYSIPYERAVEFDLTTFPDPETFTDLCSRHELTKTYTVDEVTRGGSHSRFWHWYNDQVLMITCANPITGDKMHPSGRFELREPGYASRVMLKGISDAVIDLYGDIVADAAHIKGGQVNEGRIGEDGTRFECEDRYPDQFQQFWDNEFDIPELK